MNGKSLTTRIDSLERNQSREGDAAALAWGQTVTDDELSQAANRTSAVQYLATRPASAMDDAELYRIIKPTIESLRA